MATEWRYFHCINCGTVWRDDCDSNGALHVIMPCPVCKINCCDIPKDDALGKEEIENAIINQYPFFGMLESEKVFMEEQERLHENPLKGVLGHVAKVTQTEDDQTFGIKLNERSREFVNNIYKKQRFDRDDIQYPINWDEVWDKIVDADKS